LVGVGVGVFVAVGVFVGVFVGVLVTVGVTVLVGVGVGVLLGVGVGVGNPFEPQLPITVVVTYTPANLGDTTPPLSGIFVPPLEGVRLPLLTVPLQPQIFNEGFELLRVLVCVFSLQSVNVKSTDNETLGLLATNK
jgi:hypothetical protein